MPDSTRRSKCPICGAAIQTDATLCPACGSDLAWGKESEQCPACGARMAAREESCPICGAQRVNELTGPTPSLWSITLGILAVLAFVGAAWLLKPWNQLAKVPEALLPPTLTYTARPTAPALATPSLGPTATPTSTATQAQTATVPSTHTLTPSPAPTRAFEITHTVEAGDTLGGLAVKYDVPAAEIARANNISLNAILSIGQKLRIPLTSPTAVARASTAPTFTPVASPTPAQTVTPSPTGRPTLTPAPTSALPYPAPILLGPIQGSLFTGAEARILLHWASVGILDGQEWYVVRLWQGEQEELVQEVWTKATSWRVPAKLYPGAGSATRFRWQVRVVVRTAPERPPVSLSPASEVREFLWQ